MINGKPHLSATQIEMLSRCGEQYRRRYVEREIIPPAIALLIGGGYHVGAEVNFRQKIESHEDLPKADIVDAAVEGFKLRVADGYSLTDEEVSRGAKMVVGDATDLVSNLASCYATEQAPRHQPIAVEESVTLPLPEATHDLLGIIDLVDDDTSVIDLKTAARKPPEREAHDSTQLTIYAALHHARYACLPRRVGLDVVTKTRVPASHLFWSTRGDGAIAGLARLLNTIIRAIELEVFVPCSANSWQCDPKYCGYWSTCPYMDSDRIAAWRSRAIVSIQTGEEK